jgi:hypothetical protein
MMDAQEMAVAALRQKLLIEEVFEKYASPRRVCWYGYDSQASLDWLIKDVV